MTGGWDLGCGSAILICHAILLLRRDAGYCMVHYVNPATNNKTVNADKQISWARSFVRSLHFCSHHVESDGLPCSWLTMCRGGQPVFLQRGRSTSPSSAKSTPCTIAT